MAGMTDEEARAALPDLQRLVLYGQPPQGPITANGDTNGFHPTEITPGGIYSAADLLGSYRTEWQPMPGGKQVCVHPVSPEEVIWLNAQAVREARAIPKLAESEYPLQVRIRAQVYQVICCCRTGEEPNAPQVFGPEHAEALRRNRGLYSTIQRICRLSDELGGAEDEADQLREALADFFGRAGSWLETCSSGLSAETCEGWRQALAAFAAHVSPWKQPGSLSLTDLRQALPLLPVTPGE